MLTRLKVTGFKNLVGVDVRFGPFTCIAGANGVGKSNLMDALRFLSALAGSQTLTKAALRVRNESGRVADIRDLFHRVGGRHAKAMSFEAEMIVPRETVDDFGQAACAATTFVRYALELRWRRSRKGAQGDGQLEILREALDHIPLGDAPGRLLFRHSAGRWRKSVLLGRRKVPFISTLEREGKRYIRLHQDGGGGGKPLEHLAAQLPRTVLSSANAMVSPTALCVRREMESWKFLHLEPAALRKPDDFYASTQLAPDGQHLPATLYRLAQAAAGDGVPAGEANPVCVAVADRLRELTDEVKSVWVEPDPKREWLTLQVRSGDGADFPARSLSDGSLRFLALAVLEQDRSAQGVIYLEEPENGIHPERMEAMLQLLQDMAMDCSWEVGAENPLRQVIINTHSPSVALEVPDDSLLVAENKLVKEDMQRYERVDFGCLKDTWRAKASEPAREVSREVRR